MKDQQIDCAYWLLSNCSADEIPILRVKGSDLTLSYFEENGFEVPILVENKEGLDIKVPPCNFSIQDIENHVGMYEISCFSFFADFVYKFNIYFKLK